MKVALLLSIAAFSVANARIFNNPVLDGAQYPDPGVIKFDGVYYAVTTSGKTVPNKFPIHASTDLENWELLGYIFNSTNFPKWSRPDYDFWAPEIHQVGDEFRVYFTARDNATDVLGLGVASAPHPAGPYTPQDEALLTDKAMWETDPTLIKWNGSLILCWVGTQNSWIRIRNLTDDGLSFKDNNTILLFNFDLPWEWERTEGPWYIFRNDWHYIFYSANNYCSNDYVLSVARSRNLAGPYEKLGVPILESDDKFKGPGHGSIVRDVDDEAWVFVHHAWKAGEVCVSGKHRVMMVTSMEWGDDDWPKTMHMT